MLKVRVPTAVFEQAVTLLGGDAKLAAWFVSEMEERAECELAVAIADQAVVSSDNFKATHRPIDGLGQCVMRMAKTLHDWIIKWVGPEYVYDSAFIGQLIKDNSHMCLRPAYQRRAAIIVNKPWEKKAA